MAILTDNIAVVSTSDTPDNILLELARIGDKSAYAELWSRHERTLCATVRSLAHSNTEDVVAETFAQIWEQIQNNRGPIDNFRAYSITVARNITARWYRTTRALQDLYVYPMAESPVSEVSEIIEDQREISTAFASLPHRWQIALWRIEVNGESRATVAAAMGLNPNSLSVLLRRAKEGLREAWLIQQLPRIGDHSEYLSELPRYVRGTLPPRKRTVVKKHLHDCPKCKAVLLTLQDNNQKLAAASVAAMALTGAGTITALTIPGATSGAAAVITGAGWVSAGIPAIFTGLAAFFQGIWAWINQNKLIAISSVAATFTVLSFFIAPYVFGAEYSSAPAATTANAVDSNTATQNNVSTPAPVPVVETPAQPPEQNPQISTINYTPTETPISEPEIPIPSNAVPLPVLTPVQQPTIPTAPPAPTTPPAPPKESAPTKNTCDKKGVPSTTQDIPKDLLSLFGKAITDLTRAPDCANMFESVREKATISTNNILTFTAEIKTDQTNRVFVLDSKTNKPKEIQRNAKGEYALSFNDLSVSDAVTVYVLDKNNNWTRKEFNFSKAN